MPTEHSGSDSRGPSSPAEFVDELWRRYAAALTRYARRRAPGVDADDIVSEVFAQTLHALEQGHGTVEHPRAYLYAATRNQIAREQRRRQRLDALADHEAAAGELSARAEPTPSDLTLVHEVLAGFSPTDQGLLFQVLGESRRLGDVAHDLGLTPAAASRRLYKVRSTFRARWIQIHVAVSEAPETCRPYLEVAGPVLAGTSTDAVAQEFWDHVHGCPVCPTIVAEARRGARTLAVVPPSVVLMSLGVHGTTGDGTSSRGDSSAITARRSGIHGRFGVPQAAGSSRPSSSEPSSSDRTFVTTPVPQSPAPPWSPHPAPRHRSRPRPHPLRVGSPQLHPRPRRLVHSRGGSPDLSPRHSRSPNRRGAPPRVTSVRGPSARSAMTSPGRLGFAS